MFAQLIELTGQASILGASVMYALVPGFRSTVNDRLADAVVSLPLPALRLQRLTIYGNRLKSTQQRLFERAKGLEYDAKVVSERMQSLEASIAEATSDLAFMQSQVASGTQAYTAADFERCARELVDFETELADQSALHKTLCDVTAATLAHCREADEACAEFEAKLERATIAAQLGDSASDACRIIKSNREFASANSKLGRLTTDIMRESYVNVESLKALNCRKRAGVAASNSRSSRVREICAQYGVSLSGTAQTAALTSRTDTAEAS